MPTLVVPLAGDVDRNFNAVKLGEVATVVPLAGDVDRNSTNVAARYLDEVVPLAGDVDRNPVQAVVGLFVLGRPPRGGRG